MPPDPLLDAVLANPGAREPRLAFGKAAGGARESFIQLQLTASDAQRAGKSSPALVEADRLLATGDRRLAWANGILERVPEARFLRGFVELLVIDAAKLVIEHRDLYARAPIRHLDVTDARPQLATLFGSAALAPIVGLSFNLDGTPHGGKPVGDGVVDALLASPHLGNLRFLDLRGQELSAAAMLRLARAPQLAALEVGLLDGLTEDVSTDYDRTITDVRPSDPLAAFEQTVGTRVPWLHPVETTNRRVVRDAF